MAAPFILRLINLKHDHIIHIHDIYRVYSDLYIFMELASGDVHDFMEAHHGPLDPVIACYWFAQIASAVKFLHI